ncbi:MAG: urea carboxylase-associated protein 2 [Actinomycetia bacterium]|jgi:urea carboxylase-associated protein 2|nr:urea carboxylase-associated protein 2 [Actinomycetes bacterium]
MSNTGTTKGAREHARAQAGTATRFRPTIPAREVADPPPGVPAEQLLWADLLGPGDYAARILPRGATVQLVDVDGDACASVLVYNAVRPIERLNVADTVKVQWQAYLGVGSLLLSDMGRVLMSIVGNTGGAHDALCGCSNERRNTDKYGTGGAHGPYPNARDRFAVALAKYGLERRDLAPNINFFKGARVSENGALAFTGDASAPGATVELRAELPVLFAVVNAPHVLDPRPTYSVSPLRVTAWAGEPTGPNDPLWTSSPESERAFLQTEDFQ